MLAKHCGPAFGAAKSHSQRFSSEGAHLSAPPRKSQLVGVCARSSFPPHTTHPILAVEGGRREMGRADEAKRHVPRAATKLRPSAIALTAASPHPYHGPEPQALECVQSSLLSQRRPTSPRARCRAPGVRSAARNVNLCTQKTLHSTLRRGSTAAGRGLGGGRRRPGARPPINCRWPHSPPRPRHFPLASSSLAHFLADGLIICSGRTHAANSSGVKKPRPAGPPASMRVVPSLCAFLATCDALS